MLYREPGEVGTAASLSKDGKSVAGTKGSKQIVGKPSKQGLGWFGRIAFEPQDRNFIGFYLDTLIVDGDVGEVILNPSAATRAPFVCKWWDAWDAARI